MTGRLIAVGMMVVGVSLLGVVSATLAATFVARFRGDAQQEADAAKAEVAQLRRDVAQLQAGMDALLAASGITPPDVPAAVTSLPAKSRAAK